MRVCRPGHVARHVPFQKTGCSTGREGSVEQRTERPTGAGSSKPTQNRQDYGTQDQRSMQMNTGTGHPALPPPPQATSAVPGRCETGNTAEGGLSFHKKKPSVSATNFLSKAAQARTEAATTGPDASAFRVVGKPVTGLSYTDLAGRISNRYITNLTTLVGHGLVKVESFKAGGTEVGTPFNKSGESVSALLYLRHS
ncbi:hypothetical protein Tb927.3.4010 [Trypanosoma brucei brucei TREU927]|uniref:Uncharacterized protein n=1 Tax=Trypanosoma brucei brucei (strain 927/4 GUTat10.1) TaxID=185431 RepID=Q57WD7_TRYB2|nr:hypothetical protein Tb927.3.4010 [Trypanosoma brucei brucei TREU927]AAX70096.1 hypothetical protein Tb927.3.4010 [Trypanosoma brucei]AAZ10434.1 hypothetical protein Tb927.3.4010 [Trypanosoma brucei brucei TREU927]